MKDGFNTFAGYQNSSHAVFFAVLLIVGLAGAIIFFPVNIEGEETCLFDHLIATGENELRASPKPKSITDLNLLDNYMHNYSIWWWVSLGVVAFAIFKIHKLNFITPTTQSDTYKINMGNHI